MFFDIAALRENPSVAGWVKDQKWGSSVRSEIKGQCSLIKGMPTILLNLYGSTAAKVVVDAR
jgi:hypothetical protein